MAQISLNLRRLRRAARPTRRRRRRCCCCCWGSVDSTATSSLVLGEVQVIGDTSVISNKCSSSVSLFINVSQSSFFIISYRRSHPMGYY